MVIIPPLKSPTDGINKFATKPTPCRVPYSIAYTLDYVSNSLKSLAEYDILGCCRWHRLFMSDCSESDKVYDAAKRSIDAIKQLVTNPNYTIPLNNRCEMASVSDDILLISKLCRGKEFTAACKNSQESKNFISHIIDVHSGNMSLEDFNDDCFAYSYLTLLWNLHSLLNSFKMYFQ